nr:MAG TPA: hypothetical protein [Caudoviricetes sp.]
MPIGISVIHFYLFTIYLLTKKTSIIFDVF